MYNNVEILTRNVLLEATMGGNLWRPFLRHRTAGRHQADVGAGKIIVFQGLNLQGLVAKRNFLADAALGRQCYNF